MALGQQFLIGTFQRFGKTEMPLFALGGHGGKLHPAIGKILLHPRLALGQPLQLSGQRQWQLPAYRHAKAAIKNRSALRRSPQHPPFAIQSQQRPVTGIKRTLGAGGNAGISQMHFQPRQQFGQHDGLFHIVHAAGRQAIEHIFGFSQPGHEDHRHGCQCRIGLDAPRRLEPVDARHHRIHQHQIGQFRSQAGECGVAIPGNAHAIAFAFQRVGEEAQRIRRVVHHQYGGVMGFGHGVFSPFATSGCCSASNF